MKIKLRFLSYIVIAVGLLAFMTAGGFLLYFVVNQLITLLPGVSFGGTDIESIITYVRLGVLIFPLFWGLILFLIALNYFLKATGNLFKEKKPFYIMNIIDLSIIALIHLCYVAIGGFFYLNLAIYAACLAVPFIILIFGCSLHTGSYKRKRQMKMQSDEEAAQAQQQDQQ